MNRLKFTIQSFIVAYALTIGLNVFAQKQIVPKLQWANGLTGKGNISVVEPGDGYIEIGEMGSVIHVGGYNSAIDFDPGTANLELSSPLTSIYIWKCDKNGKFLWVKTLNYEEMSPVGFPALGTTALSVDQETGDIYLTGIFGDTTIDFDPGIGIAKMIPGHSMGGTYWPSLFILKLNAAGDFEWVRQLDVYNGGGISASAIAQHNSGESKLIYFTGSAATWMDFDNTFDIIPYDFDPGADTAYIRPKNGTDPIAYMLCLNGRGEFVWVKNIAESNGVLWDFSPENIVVNENNIFVSGVFTGTADVNPMAAVYNISGKSDMFLLKYKLDGELEWARQSEVGATVFRGMENPSWVLKNIGADKMALDKKGNIFLSLDFTGPINFNKMMPFGGPATIINAAFYADATFTTTTALVKYGNNGDFEWIKQIGGKDTVNRTINARLSVAKDGKLYLSGRYNNSVDLNPGADSFILTGSNNYHAYDNNYLAQYDTTGHFIWGANILEGTTVGSVAIINAMRSEEDGSVFMTGGWWGGAIDVDPAPANFILTPANNDNFSAFILKLKIAAIDTTDTTTSINERMLSLGVKVYPNPTVGILGIESDRSLADAAIIITNISGQVVFQKTQLRGNQFQFDLTALAAGTYFFEVREGAGKRSYKLVKQ